MNIAILRVTYRPDGWKDVDSAARAFAEAGKVVHAGICARIPRIVRKGIAFYGSFRSRKDAPGRCGVERTDSPRPRWIVLRLSRAAEGNSGELQPGERIDGNENSRADSNRRDSGPG